MSRIKKLLVAIVVASVFAGIAWTAGIRYSESLPKLYRSSVTISVGTALGSRKDLRGYSQTQQEDLEMRMLSRQIISEDVLTRVSRDPDIRRILRQNIQVEPVKGTRLIKIKLDGHQPRQVADLANAVAAGFAALKSEQAEQEYLQLMQKLKQEHQQNVDALAESQMRLEALGDDTPEVQSRQRDVVSMYRGLVAVTQSRLEQFRSLQERGSVVDIVEPATPSIEPAYPNVPLIASFAAFGGFLAGFAFTVMGFAFLRHGS